MERTNARYLTQLTEKVQTVTIDVSFISLMHILPPAVSISSTSANIIVLVKPQFEAPKTEVNRKGIVEDDAVRQSTVEMIYRYSQLSGLVYRGLIRSPLIGPSGNQEFLMWFKKNGGESDFEDDLNTVFTQTH
jgi:23S rRNA (cytidine1920-2'-O)/16S rRNA (cytidine1409-2'-O)-methyltransferase